MVRLVKAHGMTTQPPACHTVNVTTLTNSNGTLSADLFDQHGYFTLTVRGDTGRIIDRITSYGETALCVALCRAYEALGK
jgi:hypothetical protein